MKYKIKSLLGEGGIRYKKSPYGEYIRFDFENDNGQSIGYTNIRLKKGWNQVHIEVFPEFQGKGYSYEMLRTNIKEYNYINVSPGRVTNPIAFKILNKFKQDANYEVFETTFGEIIISNKTLSKEEILDILK